MSKCMFNILIILTSFAEHKCKFENVLPKNQMTMDTLV